MRTDSSFSDTGELLPIQYKGYFGGTPERTAWMVHEEVDCHRRNEHEEYILVSGITKKFLYLEDVAKLFAVPEKQR